MPWAIQMRSENKLDGYREYFHQRGWPAGYPGTGPLLFRTRKEARYFIEQYYGYERDRRDLKEEPHGWKMPRAVHVKVTLEPTSVCLKGEPK